MAEKTHASRLASYKNAGHGTTDLRRKRAELSVSLRKQARDEQLLKRRAMSPEANEVVEEKVASPQEIVKGLKSEDLAVRTQSARAARRMLSREQNPPINLMVDAGVVKPLIQSLDRDDCPDLQFEAAWALTNIASGTHENTLAVMNAGAIPKLVALVGGGGAVGEQCAWALGNIAGDGAAARDAVLQHGALPALLPLLRDTTAARRTAVRTYSNLCRNKNPLVKFELVSPALPFISDLLEESDQDVLADACWALSYLTDGPNDRIEGVQQTPNLLRRPVKLLDHKSPAVRTPALRATGNMLTGSDVQDLRRKRAELSVSLRKQARDEQLLKRRAMSPEANEVVEEKVASPQEIVKGLKSEDLAVRTQSARAARRMLSREQNPPINLMVDAGVVKPLIQSLDRDDCPDLQFEAAWALTNIASGTHENTLAVMNAGAIPKLVALVGGGGAVGEQCAWALGNIAGDGAAARDAVLQHGALPALLPLLRDTTAARRTAVRTYSNLCRNKNPLVKFELVSPALPFISDLLEESDQDVLADACWALSYLTDGPNDRIEGVQQTPNLLRRPVKLLDHKSPAVRTPALRATGNMLTGSDVQTDRCIEVGCIEHICRQLRCGKPSVMKEAAWAASNVLAGTTAQIQAALHAGVLSHLQHVLTEGDIKCQKEAAWAVINLYLGGTPEQVDALLSSGYLEPYCALLDASDHRAVTTALDELANLLQAAVKFGQVEPLCLKIEEIGALDKIEALQKHKNKQVYGKAVAIMENYFSEQED